MESTGIEPVSSPLQGDAGMTTLAHFPYRQDRNTTQTMIFA